MIKITPKPGDSEKFLILMNKTTKPNIIGETPPNISKNRRNIINFNFQISINFLFEFDFLYLS